MRWLSKVMVIDFIHPFLDIWGTFKRTSIIFMMGWSSLSYFVDKYRFRHARQNLSQSQSNEYECRRVATSFFANIKREVLAMRLLWPLISTTGNHWLPSCLRFITYVASNLFASCWTCKRSSSPRQGSRAIKFAMPSENSLPCVAHGPQSLR